MIERILARLKSLFCSPALKAEPQTSGDIMPEPSVDASAQAQTTASTDINQQSAVPAETTTSALEKAKADFEAFVAFVEHGIAVLGKEAESKLVALKDEFL